MPKEPNAVVDEILTYKFTRERDARLATRCSALGQRAFKVVGQNWVDFIRGDCDSVGRALLEHTSLTKAAVSEPTPAPASRREISSHSAVNIDAINRAVAGGVMNWPRSERRSGSSFRFASRRKKSIASTNAVVLSTTRSMPRLSLCGQAVALSLERTLF